MSFVRSSLRVGFITSLLVAGLAPRAASQELPLSGVAGTDYVYATSPTGSSRLFVSNIFRFPNPVGLAPAVNNVPSRWAHRRRTLGAVETAIVSPERGVFLIPMGTTNGTGAIHIVDQRSGTLSSLTPTGGNPAGYDLAFSKSLQMVFSAEDDGAGHTILRGYSYQTLGTLTPLSPASLTLPGAPSAYVNRIGTQAGVGELHVPTVSGVQVISLSPSAPNMALGTFISSGSAVPTTNPMRFDRNGQSTWIVGTSTFDAQNQPVTGGFLTWTAAGTTTSGVFGTVPTAPSKTWVPAAGTEELAVVGNGIDTYVYYLLREPGPGTFFVKAAAVGAIKFAASAAPTVSNLLMTDDIGEPFANPAVSGTRVAFETSFGPPFIFNPPEGGEKICIIYTPLDALGGTQHGVVGNPNPLGGRISTRGMDQPIWSRDGKRVMAATSHFPGAANPGVPGLEILDVPADIVLNQFMGPHTVVANNPFPNQSVIFPSAFNPRDPAKAPSFNGLTFFGNVFNQGTASLVAPASGEIGQLQIDPTGFALSSAIPNFRSILPPSFDDTHTSITPVPGNFGARRTTFNATPAKAFGGLVMTAAYNDGLYVQMTSVNIQALFGIGISLGTVRTSLPAGWVTTSEFLSL